MLKEGFWLKCRIRLQSSSCVRPNTSTKESAHPDATRQFFADLFGWKVAAESAEPGYTFVDTGVDGGTHVAISPRQGLEDEVLFFVAVDDVAATLEQAQKLGGTIVQPTQQVPGTTFGVFADSQGHRVGVAAIG